MTVNGKRAELSLKRKLAVSNWDSTKNRLKGLSHEVSIINSYLNQVYLKLFECHQQLQQENKLISAVCFFLN
ncbi:Arm DNA-binding domain-containing protein [Flavivirga rizhaonensis]|uniref:Arm DNA-binding domain-containing protein n=1 Tax=Flavivirga rizhaonensis TaxID=2559571 RepID=A0A4S1DZ17_9FLAO|nr:hypothetical protein EM932_06975 [Flavivirga rizhaonensis]